MTIGVAPRSDAIEKYARLVVARMIMANWWKRRVPRGRYMVFSQYMVSPRRRTRAYRKVQEHSDQQSESDQGERCPKPVRTMGADVDVSVRWVEVEGVVGHLSCSVKRREVR